MYTQEELIKRRNSLEEMFELKEQIIGSGWVGAGELQQIEEMELEYDYSDPHFDEWSDLAWIESQIEGEA